ncbi:MAG: hypothetical protein LBD35_01290 [Prevotellaceae bacterium]|jgi:hypothetical protein|nr:hypothetical protein [Prevotellaceae bacterium]
MYRSIIYKEWIKTRTATGFIVLAFAAAAIHSFMKIAEDLRLSGAAACWELVIQKDPAMFPLFEYLPAIAGVLAALAQYVPELQSKRLKLTLHLPLKEDAILLAMSAYGTAVVTLVTAFFGAVLLWGLSANFPAEIAGASFRRLLPGFMAGPSAYFLASWICLEPRWSRRVLNFIPGALALSLFFMRAKSGAFCPLVPWLGGFMAAAFFFVFQSTARFKDGVQ